VDLREPEVLGVNEAVKWLHVTLLVPVLLMAAGLAGCGHTHQTGADIGSVRTVRCPTAFGVEGAHVKTPARTVAVRNSMSVDSQLRYYVGGIPVLAPAGWRCKSLVSVDGGASITVKPATRARGRSSAGVTVDEVSACQGCMAELVCPYFPHAEQQLGYSMPCPGRRPAEYVARHVGRNVVSFTSARGPNMMLGLVVFLPPADRRSDSASEISCQLPAAKRALCEAVVNTYLADLKKESPAQFVASWPTKTTTHTTTSQSGSSQPGYLAVASNGVLFIQWTRAVDTVTGTLSESYTSPSNSAQLTHESDSFTGVVSGNAVTLKLDSGVDWNGTLSGSSVTLSYTANNGTLSTFTFKQASVAAYNSAVSRLTADATNAASAQAHVRATQQTEQSLNADATAVTSDISDVQNSVGQLGTDLKQVPSDLAQMRDDLASQKKDLDQLIAAGRSGCQDDEYQVADSDKYQVTSSDDYQITSSDAYTINNDRQAVTQAISTLTSDSRDEQTDQAALPGYAPAGLPSASQISRAISSASGSVQAMTNTWNGYLTMVRQLDAASNGYSAQARNTCAT
jgi:hypothetical protein